MSTGDALCHRGQRSVELAVEEDAVLSDVDDMHATVPLAHEPRARQRRWLDGRSNGGSCMPRTQTDRSIVSLGLLLLHMLPDDAAGMSRQAAQPLRL